MIQDLLLNDKQKLWLWMKEKKLFSSIDLARYNAFNYTLRAGRSAREWSIPKERTNVEPRLNRLKYEQKLFMGLIRNGNANIAWYELNPNFTGGLND